MSAPDQEKPAALRFTHWLAGWLAFLAGLGVIALAFLICIDIGARSLLRVSIQGSDELGGYALALVGSLGLAHTLLQRAHPRVDLGLKFLPRRAQSALLVLALAAMAGMACFMVWQGWGEMEKTLRFGTITNTPLQTPLWVPQGLWLSGLAFFALTAILATVHGFKLLLRDPQQVVAHYGAKAVEEEIADYVDPNAAEGKS